MYSNCKLLLITLFVICLVKPAFAVEEREGFYKTLTVTQDSPCHLLTVPQGKKFVLLQISSTDQYFTLEADSNVAIDGRPLFLNDSNGGGLSHDFPDRCVVFEQGQVLEVVKPTGGMYICFVGYFFNFNCTSFPVSDLNKDCKVNFGDLAILASEWLADNTLLT